MIRHITALSYTSWLALKYSSIFEIKGHERGRYWRKCVHLTLCYLDFSRRNNLSEAIGAGFAGFASCGYDVITDWRHFDKQALRPFFVFLKENTNVTVYQQALRMYAEDEANSLAMDGLERGVIAFELVTKVMACYEFYRDEARYLGTLLQIVDDVLDYENDLAAGETNCLQSPNGRKYLSQLLAITDDNLERWFPKKRLIHFVIRKAQTKAGKLVADLPVSIS